MLKVSKGVEVMKLVLGVREMEPLWLILAITKVYRSWQSIYYSSDKIIYGLPIIV